MVNSIGVVIVTIFIEVMMPVAVFAEDSSVCDNVQGDYERGRVVFFRCQSCHSLELDRNGFGPSLRGVIGRRSGSLVRFSYSQAMSKSNLLWTPELLNVYLENPQNLVPDNRMSFPGINKVEDRFAVIKYLCEFPIKGGSFR
jgi:cytochrome c2